MVKTSRLLGILVLSLTIGLLTGTAFAGTAYNYGPNDQVGSLNEMTPASVAAAANLVKKGKIYDLDAGRFRGMPLWPGHPPYEVITFRTPMGLDNQKDQGWLQTNNDVHIGFISEVMIGTMHTGCHMDSLAHITVGQDHHWYNGKQDPDLGDWGPLKSDISTTPPVVTRGVMIDVAGYKGVKMLPAGYCITVADLKGALAKQGGPALKPGDTVLVRTGQMAAWADKAEMAKGGGAGLGIEAMKWLMENNKGILFGVDQAAFECDSPDKTNPHPVHQYMLIDNGVHIMEFTYLEDLAKDKVYEFMFVALPLKNKGCTGSMIRPIAVN
ncbi:MAG: cyclase family protein [bacterium]